MLSEQYIAGVMDSDGSFSLVRRKWKNPRGYVYRICIQLGWKSSQESANVLKEIVTLYGGRVCTYTRKQTNLSSRCSPMLKFMCEGDEAVKMAASLLPHLRLKTRQAELIASLAKIRRAWLGDRKSAPNKPQWAWAQEDAIYSQFLKINTKNAGKGRSKP
jgi:hypothetical protein